jgi:hypothetical protein
MTDTASCVWGLLGVATDAIGYKNYWEVGWTTS